MLIVVLSFQNVILIVVVPKLLQRFLKIKFCPKIRKEERKFESSLISYHFKNTPTWLTFLVYDWAFTYAFVNLKCMAILKIWTTKQNKKYGNYDVTLLLNTPRVTRWRHRPLSSVKPKTDEEAKERREGWHDIYVQGRPHWDGTGNANYYWCDVPVTHLSISHH